MKIQTTKKLFAFMIIMMFSCLTQFVLAQKCKKDQQCPSGYTCVNGYCQPITCNCATRGYGCGGDSRCIWFCSRIGQCGVKVIDRTKLVNGTVITGRPADSDSQSATILFLLPQSEKNSTKIFDITAESAKMSVDSKMQGINQFEWDAIDKKENALKGVDN